MIHDFFLLLDKSLAYAITVMTRNWQWNFANRITPEKISLSVFPFRSLLIAASSVPYTHTYIENGSILY